MRIKHLAAIAGMIVGLGASTGALAASAPAPGEAIGGLDVIQVQRDDCHESVRRHYLEEYGRRVAHYHRGRSCRAVIVDGDGGGGGGRDRDCHRDPQRHYLDEYGRRVWHRHVGPRCRVDTLREYREERRDEGCFRAGPVTVCP